MSELVGQGQAWVGVEGESDGDAISLADARFAAGGAVQEQAVPPVARGGQADAKGGHSVQGARDVHVPPLPETSADAGRYVDREEGADALNGTYKLECAPIARPTALAAARLAALITLAALVR